jgi:hypothetical protein
MERKIDQLEKQQNDIADAAKRVTLFIFFFHKNFIFFLVRRSDW